MLRAVLIADTLEWVTAVAALATLMAALAGVAIPIWWRRPQLTVEPQTGWNTGPMSQPVQPGEPPWIGLPVSITNDGPTIVRNMHVRGTVDGRDATEAVRVDIAPGATARHEIRFQHPTQIRQGADGRHVVMPAGQLGVRVTVGRLWKWEAPWAAGTEK